MSRRVQIYVLVSLLASLAWLFFRDAVGMFSGSSNTPNTVAANVKFTPLDIQEPDLRLDLLQKIHNTKYEGNQRDIFSGQPLPPPASAHRKNPHPDPVAQAPAPPPPVQVPAQFFGYANRSGSSERVAFFLNGDDVLVVAEGDTFLGNFRLLHIGNDSAQVEEISSGRQTSVPLEQPPDQSAVNP
ncbi:MAG TPA: hypothetical protein VMF66_13025 [Candidatus Acidoferrum sp.]|nr:hypothetical protein [Candidatus Acidoferrum sp.]